MHYYKRNIGDYAKKAGRLSMLQHGSYTLLIDACYDREKFPTIGEAIEWTWASTKEESEAVIFVLNKFFTLKDDVYVQQRIEDELNEYKEKSVTNKRIAIDRETIRREKSTSRARVVDDLTKSGDESPPNHKPLTTNHKPITIKDNASVAPFGVCDVVWSDFLKIRRAKKSPMTNTALAGIQREADKAGVTLEDALKTCCERGWIGFKAEWLADKSDLSETVYQKSMRLRVAEIAPEIARAAPGSNDITDYFRTIEASTVKTLEISK